MTVGATHSVQRQRVSLPPAPAGDRGSVFAHVCVPAARVAQLSNGAVNLLHETTRRQPVLGQALASYLIDPVGSDAELRARMIGDQVEVVAELLSSGGVDSQNAALAVAARVRPSLEDAGAEWIGRLAELLAGFSSAEGVPDNEQRRRRGAVVATLLSHGPPYDVLRATREREGASLALTPSDADAVIEAARGDRFWGGAFLEAHTAGDVSPHVVTTLMDTAVSLGVSDAIIVPAFNLPCTL